MKEELVTAAFGATLGIAGTATQTNEILETISLILTIAGAVVSFIVVPLLNWYLRAKRDGKITTDEIKEGFETLNDGIEKTKEVTKKQNGGKKDGLEEDPGPKG